MKGFFVFAPRESLLSRGKKTKKPILLRSNKRFYFCNISLFQISGANLVYQSSLLQSKENKKSLFFAQQKILFICNASLHRSAQLIWLIKSSVVKTKKLFNLQRQRAKWINIGLLL
ncbi:MAG: hypothetical protein Q8L81_07100 [Bacteroidota bacterium]|nr:hypothetical protein [Bacteroidota bacterium]